MSTRVFKIADLYAGAGGTSSGAVKAIRALGADVDLVAVNHWAIAIASHSANHPKARHYVEDVNGADPNRIVPEGYLDLLLASPECIFFSRARGGKPVSDQGRMSTWAIQRWLTALDVRCVLVENVSEFVDWSPLLPTGRPDPSRKGLYFQAWLKSLWGLGYATDWRFINAADFGDATTRTRFFLQARKDGRPIRWPEPSHSPTGSADMFGSRPRWRAAREIIDWSKPGRSLFDRPRPLSLKTRQRIGRGLERFGGVLAPLYLRLLDLDGEAASNGAPKPFLAVMRQNNLPKSIDGPLPTITTIPAMYVCEPTAEPLVMANCQNNVPKPTLTTATGGGVYLIEPAAEPFVTPFYGHKNGQPRSPRSVEEPLGTITTEPRFGLGVPTAEPFVLGQQSGSAPRSSENPLPTIATDGAIALVDPLLVEYHGRGECSPTSEPLSTILTKDRLGLAEAEARPFILSRFSNDTQRSTDAPVPTVVGSGAGYLVEPFITPHFGERDGQAPRVHDLEQPLPTVTGQGAGSLVEPVVVQIDQSGRWGPGVRSADAPLPTMTTKASLAVALPLLERACSAGIDPRRLVFIGGELYVLDIRFRMLTNRELARAMGFDDAETEYEFHGTKTEVTRQIGNAVAVSVAAALVRAILDDGETP